MENVKLDIQTLDNILIEIFNIIEKQKQEIAIIERICDSNDSENYLRNESWFLIKEKFDNNIDIFKLNLKKIEETLQNIKNKTNIYGEIDTSIIKTFEG